MVDRSHRERGFTVVELVCAFAVISLVSVSLVHGGRGHAQAMARAYHETVALRIAQAELEQLRAQRGALPTGNEELEPSASALRELPAVRVRRVVREVEPGLLEVEIGVVWTEAGAAREARVTVATLLARGSPP